MLKSKQTACAFNHFDAESLARELNAKIWPSLPRSNGVEDDEEFFDASPSPIEEADGIADDSSAGTAAGRAKLCELLQQHADDTAEIFYDVSDDPTIDVEISTPLNGDADLEHETRHDLDEPEPAQALDSQEVFKVDDVGENRPTLLRATSLKTGKTPPGTPSRKKIVRFADVLGLDLEDVRHIMTGDLPNVPSSAYTDLVVEETFRPVTIQASCGPNVLFPLFEMPGLQPDFMDRVRNRGICLESVVVSDFSIQCTCRVMNWGYHKKVSARYTLNEWASSNDIDASYVPSASQTDTDSFVFSIFVSPLHKSVKFALRYIVNNSEHWDNNNGENYCLGNHGDSHHGTETHPNWIHHFC